MSSQAPRDFAEWMQSVDRRMKVALRNSARAVQDVRETVGEVIDEARPGIPTAPVEITANGSIYKDASGAWRGRIDVDFPDVVFTVDQKPIKVSGYEMYGYEEALFEGSTPVWQQYGGSDTSSITRIDLPQGVWYVMKVRAIGGVWSSEFRVQTTKDTTPPPQPTMPTAEVFLGAITVRWDKKAVTGDMPADFEAAILCVGEEPSPGLDKAVTRFDMHENIFVITGAKYYKPVYIRLIAVDFSGNLSPWSEQTTAMTKPLVDSDIILGEIDAGKTIIKNAEKLILASGAELGKRLSDADTALAATEKKLTGPGGLTERLTGAEGLLKDVGSLTYATGQTLRQKLTASDTAISTAQGQINTLRDTTLPKLSGDLSAAAQRITQTETDLTAAAGKITTAEASIKSVADRVSPLETGINTLTKTTIPGLQTSIDGKTGILRKTAAPTDADTADPGTRWEVWSTLNAGGKLLQTWRRTATTNAWIQDVLSPAYLPQVDIGDGTFGSLKGGRLEANSITATQIDAASIAAAVGTFVKINVENITATAAATLNSVVAQRIAAGTASFQTVDAKNIFVTGTSSFNEVVAKRIAADTGQFLSISVDQLTVSGTANMAEVVANRMFANIFSTNKLTTNHLMVGKGENLIPWLVDLPAAADRTWLPHVAWGQSTLAIEGTGGRSQGPHLVIRNDAVVSGTRIEIFRFQPGTPAKNGLGNTFDVEPNTKYKASIWVRAGGSYPSGAPSVSLQTQTYVGDGSSEAGSSLFSPASAALIFNTWYEVKHEFTTGPLASSVLIRLYSNQPGAVRVDSPMLVRDGASLIATGGIVADHIMASEEMSAKIGTFLKLDVGSLTATGTSSLATAVVENLWANVVRAKQITTDMLTVGSGPNAIVDPFFDSTELKATRRSRSGNWGSWSRNATLELNWYGASGLAATVSNSFYFDAASTSEAGNMIPVEPGQKFLFKVKVNSTGSGPRATARLLLKDGTSSYSASYWEKVGGGSNGYDPTGVQDFERIFTVPDNVAYMTPAVQWPNATTAAYVYGGASFTNMATASLIVDGAIVTKKLTVTEDMTVALLKAHKVEASEIDVNSLKADTAWIGSLRTGILVTDVVTSTHIKSDSITADLLKADAITSKHTLTGPLIRSAASGARTEMNNQGIRVLNASNVELVRLGYGIATGMSIRNPNTGVLAPLSPMVFGTDYLTGFSNVVYNTVDVSGNTFHPDLVNFGFTYLSKQYTAVSESAVFFWETNVYCTMPTVSTLPPADEINFRIGMSIHNLSAGPPLSVPDTGQHGRMVPAKGRILHNGGVSFTDYATPVTGMGVVTGLTPGTKYSIPVFLQGPTRYNPPGMMNVALRYTIAGIKMTVLPR